MLVLVEPGKQTKIFNAACYIQPRFLLRQDEPGAINYKKAAPGRDFFKGPGANFFRTRSHPKIQEIFILVFSVSNKDMGLLIVKLASL